MRGEQSIAELCRCERIASSMSYGRSKELRDTGRSLHSAEDTLPQSRVAVTSNVVSLNKALGGGWDRPVEVEGKRVVAVNTGPHRRAAYWAAAVSLAAARSRMAAVTVSTKPSANGERKRPAGQTTPMS